MSVRISVLVITYNKLARLKGTLAALAQQDFSADEFELIVVDDGSVDGTSAFLAEYAPRHRYQWRCQANGGRAVARNAAARMAQGELLVFVDDDCLLHEGALNSLWLAYQRSPSQMLIADIQNVAIEHVDAVLDDIATGGRIDWCRLSVLAPFEGNDMLADVIRYMKSTGTERFAVPWLVAQGAAISIGRSGFDRLQGFDERFVGYGMEDFDIGYRFYRNGGSFLFVPNARLYHLDHAHNRNQLFNESTVTTRALFRKYLGNREIQCFVKFLCGAMTFQAFNNVAAADRGIAPIEEFDTRFSPFGMIQSRDKAESIAAPQELNLHYSKGQAFKLRFLLERIQRDMRNDAIVSSALEAIEVSAAKKVLVIAPHMDDEVIGCGGLISEHSRIGSEVTVLYLTDGAMRTLPPDERAAMRTLRRHESERAADILGVKRRWYADIAERDLAAAVKDPQPLRRILDEVAPDLVLVPPMEDMHPDHRASHRWLLDALRGQAAVPQVMCYEVWGSCRPDGIFHLSDAAWAQKVRALTMYESQLRDLNYLHVMGYVSQQRGAQARGAGSMRAEAFRTLDLHSMPTPETA